MYKNKYLESTFLEIIDQSTKNVFVGCIYRHSCTDLSEFNNDYLNSLSEKLQREKNKQIILMGNLNVDILKYTTDTGTAQFLDQIYSSSLVAQITSPTHISTKSKTLFSLLEVQKIPSPET